MKGLRLMRYELSITWHIIIVRIDLIYEGIATIFDVLQVVIYIVSPN